MEIFGDGRGPWWGTGSMTGRRPLGWCAEDFSSVDDLSSKYSRYGLGLGLRKGFRRFGYELPYSYYSSDDLDSIQLEKTKLLKEVEYLEGLEEDIRKKRKEVEE